MSIEPVTTSEPNYIERESPQARLRRLGADALMDAELLSVLTGEPFELVAKVLCKYGSLRSLVTRAGYGGLSEDISEEAAQRIHAASELIRRAMCEPLRAGAPLRSSRDVQRAYGPMMAHLTEEMVRVVLLDVRQRPVAERVVARGGVGSCPVNVREIFALAIREAAAGVIMIHNHPSGDPTPSAEDIALTSQLVKAGDLIGLPLIDHVILGRSTLYSFLDVGQLRIES